MAHALIVDDDPSAAALVARLAGTHGYSTACAGSLQEARRQLALRQPDLVLLDLRLPDGSGMTLLHDPELLGDPAVVLMTGHPDVATSVQALRHRAVDYLVKPFTAEALKGLLARVPARTQTPAPVPARVLVPPGPEADLGWMVGRSPPMQAVYAQVMRVAPTDFTVLVTGESGTGKELVARTVHDRSRRRHQPFVAVNCGAISPHLIESEVFGHERGSFTGAERQHPGFFEQATGGTLFLDEVTEMPLALQVKLLRVLETGSILRVGATAPLAVDVRVVAATNRDPRRAVAEGLLREDLYWRLQVFPIHLPPLRDRRDDIGPLARHFLGQISRQEGAIRQLDDAALDRLSRHDWPGNVRELRNALQRAWVMSAGEVLERQWLPGGDVAAWARAAPVLAPPTAHAAVGARDGGIRLAIGPGMSLAEAERLLIEATLTHFGQRREAAAAALGVSLKTLYNRLKAYGLGGLTG
jgi:two-component system response regulator AtoC